MVFAIVAIEINDSRDGFFIKSLYLEFYKNRTPYFLVKSGVVLRIFLKNPEFEILIRHSKFTFWIV